MAIRIDTVHKGIPVIQAYVTVELPTVSLDKASVSFGVWFRSSREHEQFHALTYEAPYSLDAGDPFAQAYEHLKTLPEFEGCVDC
jgi:hypothetical protein